VPGLERVEEPAGGVGEVGGVVRKVSVVRPVTVEV
jgi:hypothetical protein